MYSVVQIVSAIFTVLVYIVVARCVLSFVPHNPGNFLIRFIYDVSEPVMRPFRKLIPPMGGLDFSPIVAILAVQFLREIIIRVLLSIV